MSTTPGKAVTTKIGEREVTVTAASDITEHAVNASLSCQTFRDWANSISGQFLVSKVHIQSVDLFGSGEKERVGFVKFTADVKTRDGRFVPGIVFMRGAAVAILVIITCGDKKYIVFTVQPRFAIGNASFVEIPAGMLDHSGDFLGVAAKELEEEAGLKICQTKLVNLCAIHPQQNWSSGVFPSPGGCDEVIGIYLYETEMSEAEVQELQGKMTGNLEENESITLKIVPLEDAWYQSPDSKTLCALFLYDKYLKSKAGSSS